MTNFTDNFDITDFIQSHDLKKYLKQITNQIVSIVYNELYIYVWFICFYHVFLIFIILANLFILLRISGAKQKIYP